MMMMMMMHIEDFSSNARAAAQMNGICWYRHISQQQQQQQPPHHDTPQVGPPSAVISSITNLRSSGTSRVCSHEIKKPGVETTHNSPAFSAEGRQRAARAASLSASTGARAEGTEPRIDCMMRPHLSEVFPKNLLPDESVVINLVTGQKGSLDEKGRHSNAAAEHR